jgi:hypothetical protein
MSNQPRYEKDEKDRGKHEEKTVEEKWRRDPLGSIIWAVILIWAGLVFLANSLGLFSNLPTSIFRVGGDSNSGAWTIVFLGAGVIVLIEAAIRLAVPAYRRPIVGTVIFGVILIGIGLGNLTSWDIIWPLIIIAIGASLLLGGFWRRRS